MGRLTGPYPGTAEASIEVLERSVTADYFDTLRIPLVAGRGITRAEAEEQPRPPVVVLDEALARRLFGSASPLGAEVRVRAPLRGQPDRTRSVQVVGVVGSTRSSELRDGRPPTMYVPAGLLRIATFHVRSGLPQGEAVALIRRTIRAIEPALAVDSVTTLAQDIATITAQERLLAKTGSILAVLALMMAVAGVLTVVSCGVAERTREFGIRLALGASRRRIVAEALAQSARACGIGTLTGLALYLAAARPLRSVVFEVAVLDPLSIVAFITALLAASLAATYPSARRAASIDPAVTLRAE
jgi:hypothetical protein